VGGPGDEHDLVLKILHNCLPPMWRESTHAVIHVCAYSQFRIRLYDSAFKTYDEGTVCT